MRHCPNCNGEVIIWDSDLEADKCVDCGESWSVDEQEAVREMLGEEVEEYSPPDGWPRYAGPQVNEL